eukprot:gene38-46_t
MALPTASATTPPAIGDVIAVEIDADSNILWQGQVVTAAQLDERLAQVATQAETQKIQPQIQIRSDKAAAYGVFVQVLASTRRHGLSRVAVLGAEFSAAAWVVLMHLAVLWAVLSVPPRMPPPEEADLQTLVIQDIAIAPPPPAAPPAELQEKPVSTKAVEKLLDAPSVPSPPAAPRQETSPQKPVPAASLEPEPVQVPPTAPAAVVAQTPAPAPAP